eukprot:g5631.t1
MCINVLLFIINRTHHRGQISAAFSKFNFECPSFDFQSLQDIFLKYQVMTTVGSDSKVIVDTENIEDRGVSVYFLRWFLENKIRTYPGNLKDGRPTGVFDADPNVSYLRPRDVHRNIVTVETASTHVRYFHHARDTICPAEQCDIFFGVATHFVSYSWDCDFDKLLASLERKAAEDPFKKVFFWVDIFSVNQHGPPYCTTDIPSWASMEQDANQGFRRVIESTKQTCIFIEPWYNPGALNRSWCLFELYCAIEKATRLGLPITQVLCPLTDEGGHKVLIEGAQHHFFLSYNQRTMSVHAADTYHAFRNAGYSIWYDMMEEDPSLYGMEAGATNASLGIICLLDSNATTLGDEGSKVFAIRAFQIKEILFAKDAGKIVVLVMDDQYNLADVYLNDAGDRSEELRLFLHMCPKLIMNNGVATNIETLQSLVSDIQKHTIKGTIARINCRTAQCNPTDKKIIHEMIDRDIGFDAFNESIHLELYKALLEKPNKKTFTYDSSGDNVGMNIKDLDKTKMPKVGDIITLQKEDLTPVGFDRNDHRNWVSYNPAWDNKKKAEEATKYKEISNEIKERRKKKAEEATKYKEISNEIKE